VASCERFFFPPPPLESLERQTCPVKLPRFSASDRYLHESNTIATCIYNYLDTHILLLVSAFTPLAVVLEYCSFVSGSHPVAINQFHKKQHVSQYYSRGT
jgi:hypothetical protein